ncbi:MAG: VWA domain-containing protein [Acidobacteriota bacterium]
MRRPVVIIACCAALAVPASSQPPRPAAVKADVEVNLVVVDVVVTDSNERHIEGLAPEDFELSEDGTLQGITDFSEEGTEPASAAAGAAPAMETGRRFVLFFDESRMTPNQHAHAGRAAAEFLAATIMPADLVSVLTYANAMRLEQDFTGDVEALRKALEKRGHRGAMGPEAYAGQDTISTDPLANPSPGEGARYISPDDDPREKALQGPDVTFQSVAQHARLERLREAERFYQALELVGKTLSRTPGRKTLVLFSAGIETSLGTDKHRYREMVDALNRANVAVYAVDVAGGSDTTPGDARAAYSYNPNLSTPTDAQRSTASDKKSWLRTLASDTGGESLIGRSDLRAELETVARSTSHYYMLGYSPVDTAKAGFRAISVKVKVPGAKVLTRKGYVRQKPWVELTVKEREGQLEDALSSWTDAQDLPIGLSTEFYPTTDRHALAAIDLSVRRGLATVVEGQARLKLLMRIERPNGRKVIERRRDVTLTSAESLRDVHYLEQADLKAGVYVLKVAMRDAARGRSAPRTRGSGFPISTSTARSRRRSCSSRRSRRRCSASPREPPRRPRAFDTTGKSSSRRRSAPSRPRERSYATTASATSPWTRRPGCRASSSATPSSRARRCSRATSCTTRSIGLPTRPRASPSTCAFPSAGSCQASTASRCWPTTCSRPRV